MRRISRGPSKRLIVLAALLSLALTLLFGGIASASPVASSQQVSSVAVQCISATPLSQVAGVKQTAWVTVTVHCFPATTQSYVQVKWGDGTIEYYPIVECVEVCHAPPYTIDTSHAYTNVGLYRPVFCLTPTLSTVPDCTTVQIQVVSLDPPVA
jgi:hypothetical protein